jgi:hypothetical protein
MDDTILSNIPKEHLEKTEYAHGDKWHPSETQKCRGLAKLGS